MKFNINFYGKSAWMCDVVARELQLHHMVTLLGILVGKSVGFTSSV